MAAGTEALRGLSKASPVHAVHKILQEISELLVAFEMALPECRNHQFLFRKDSRISAATIGYSVRSDGNNNQPVIAIEVKKHNRGIKIAKRELIIDPVEGTLVNTRKLSFSAAMKVLPHLVSLKRNLERDIRKNIRSGEWRIIENFLEKLNPELQYLEDVGGAFKRPFAAGIFDKRPLVFRQSLILRELAFGRPNEFDQLLVQAGEQVRQGKLLELKAKENQAMLEKKDEAYSAYSQVIAEIYDLYIQRKQPPIDNHAIALSANGSFLEIKTLEIDKAYKYRLYHRAEFNIGLDSYFSVGENMGVLFKKNEQKLSPIQGKELPSRDLLEVHIEEVRHLTSYLKVHFLTRTAEHPALRLD